MNENIELIAKLKKINTIVTDVDGVLTNGSIGIFDNNNNESFLSFSIYDGIGLELGLKANLKFFIISGRNAQSIKTRFEKFEIKEIHIGIKNKKKKLEEIIKSHKLKANEILYIGDDINDISCMKMVGVAVAPINATKETKAHANFITKTKGGEGALREVIELVLQHQEKLHKIIENYLNE